MAFKRKMMSQALRILANRDGTIELIQFYFPTEEASLSILYTCNLQESSIQKISHSALASQGVEISLLAQCSVAWL